MNKSRIIWSIIVAGLITYSVIMIRIGPSKNLLKRNLEKQKFEGVIEKKIIDTNDHFGNKIVINGHKQPIHWKLSSELDIGDSVIKLKGKSFITIYKQNGLKYKYDLLKNKKYD